MYNLVGSMFLNLFNCRAFVPNNSSTVLKAAYGSTVLFPCVRGRKRKEQQGTTRNNKEQQGTQRE
jgi:hypothetical protein